MKHCWIITLALCAALAACTQERRVEDFELIGEFTGHAKQCKEITAAATSEIVLNYDGSFRARNLPAALLRHASALDKSTLVAGSGTWSADLKSPEQVVHLAFKEIDRAPQTVIEDLCCGHAGADPFICFAMEGTKERFVLARKKSDSAAAPR